MPISDPILEISIIHGERYKVELKSCTGDKLPVTTLITPEGLNEYLGILNRGLDKFWKIVGTEVASDYYTATSALLHLHGLGRQLNRVLFGDARYDVEEFVKNAFLGTWMTNWLNTHTPPVVKVTTKSEHWLPFEFLPLFDTNEPPAIGSKDEETLKGELPLLASRFLGFAAIVSRRLAPPEGEEAEKEAEPDDQSKNIIDNLHGLRVRFFHHAGLVGAQREAKFFTGASGDKWVDLRGPWPSQPFNQRSFESELAAQLWNASVNATGEPPQSVDQIHHFACHCDTTPPASDLYSLILAHRDDQIYHIRNSKRSATIGALDRNFGGYSRRDATQTYPFVFLNACGSSKLTSIGVESFPKLFLGLEGNRGVIGTETSIPDLFAAAFSKRFYLKLIQDSNLGQALHRARWGLLIERKNPLGILYTLYGDPHLRVRRHMPKVTAPAVS